MGEFGRFPEVGNGWGVTSGDAWASSRDKEDGRALLGEEFERVREARWEDVVGATWNVSSTSGSGGPEGNAGVLLARDGF